jgi:hypothetical protein
MREKCSVEHVTRIDTNMTTPDLETPATDARRATSSFERLPEYTIYKPNSRGSGGVMRFGLNPGKAAVFVDAALQIDERQFDWENKLTMKWGMPDLGATMAVLQGRQEEAKLFHKTDKSNSAFGLVRRGDPERAPYLMSLSRQDADKSLRKVTVPLSHAEAAVLEQVLALAVRRLVGW